MRRVRSHAGRQGKVASPAGWVTAAAMALCVLAGTAPAAAADNSALPVEVSATPYGQAMPPGFLGVSFEYKATHLYTGRDPDHINPVLLALLRGLVPGQTPNVRIGGNSTDQTWWPMRGVVPPGGITYALTKGWLRTTKAFADALGGQLILGVNLSAGRPSIAAAEARALLQGIGRSRIQALEIGNEADLYRTFVWYRDRQNRIVFARSHGWNVARFDRDFARWSSVMPTAPLAGPTLSSLTWLSSLDGFLRIQRRIGVVTFHRYPLRGCTSDPTSPIYTSIPNLLLDSSSAGMAAGVAAYTVVAHKHRIPFRLDELNSASCTGKRGVSDAFASALWALDTLYNMAAVGVDGVNFHTLPGAPYEPFTFTQKDGSWSAFVHPVYYGALAFAQAFPPGARLLNVFSPPGPVKVWATQAPDGHLRVMVINKSLDTPSSVQLTLPGDATGPLSAETLSAPSLSSTNGVTWGGQSFGDSTTTGVLPGAPTTTPVTPAGGTYTIDLPAGSAMLLTR